MEVKEDLVLKRVKAVIEFGKKAVGQQSFIDLLYGDTLTTVKLIEAYCYDCTGFYEDGISDCKNPKCPLYSKMPYAKVLRSSPVTTRGKKRIRNDIMYPIASRLSPITTTIAERRDLKKVHTGRAIASKLKSRKYPQEITQKEITLEDRETALYDNAIAEYEKEKLECKEQK